MLTRPPFLIVSSWSIIGAILLLATCQEIHAQQSTRLVESVEVVGNRRLRSEDILYYVKTRPHQPYSAKQVRRDLQAILALGFFDKTAMRAKLEEGAQGGVVVIFEVQELPMIRVVKFEGLRSINESEVVEAFREQHLQIVQDAIYDPVKVREGVRLIKEMLIARGQSKAGVTAGVHQDTATSIVITFVVDEGW